MCVVKVCVGAVISDDLHGGDVHSHLQVGEQDLVESICALLLGCFRFRKFTESRWLTIGTSTRILTLAIILGLDSLVSHIKKDVWWWWCRWGVEGRSVPLQSRGRRPQPSTSASTDSTAMWVVRSDVCIHAFVCKTQDPSCSKFYINGFSRLGPQARFFSAAAAMASKVSEGFQEVLMQDPRVASSYTELWSRASQELRSLVDIPDHMWGSLATAAGCEPGQLKDKVISAGHVAYHFLWRRVLEPASQLPWKLCRDNADDHLDSIEAMESPPSEPCANHIWHLLAEKHERSQIKMVIDLLAQCSWSSLPAEQQHGSLSLLHRWHPEYGLDSLLSRAFLHQVVRLIPRESDLEKKIGRTMAKLSKIQRSNPDKVSGSHMLVAALVRVMKQRKDVGWDNKLQNIVCVCFAFLCKDVDQPHLRGISSNLVR